MIIINSKISWENFFLSINSMQRINVKKIKFELTYPFHVLPIYKKIFLNIRKKILK